MPDHQPVHLLGQRLDALLERLALVGEGEVGAVVGQARAIPQAIERLLATPMISPRLPRIRFEVSDIQFPAWPADAGHVRMA